MSGATPPVGEDDLQAYVDDRLDGSRRAAVERQLAGDGAAAQRVAEYRAQGALLRQALTAHDGDPLPERLTLAGILAERERARRGFPWRYAASIVVALGLGAAGGALLARGPGEPDRVARAMRVLEQEALATHRVYAADQRHPIEVAGTEEPHLTQWLSRRLDRPVTPPDLSALGYRIIGGRLLATEQGNPAALLMYQDGKDRRLSVVVRPMAPDLHAPAADIAAGPLNGQAWIADGLGVAVVAGLPQDDLSRVSADVRHDLTGRG